MPEGGEPYHIPFHKHNTSIHITTFSVIEIINVHEHGVKVISGYDLKFEEKNS
jgi:hypothetical protein